jgi:hypothetical protein
MKKKREKLAVSEIIGIVVLLAMAVSLFVTVQLIVLSYPFEPAAPSVNIVGSINNGNIILEHHGGDSLSLSTRIIFVINDTNDYEIITGEDDYLIISDDDNYWEIGEIISYTPSEEIVGKKVSATVVDVQTNSIVMHGILQEEAAKYS